MSMKDYAVDGYGIILNEIEGIDDDLLADLYEDGICSAEFSFTGESFPVADSGDTVWSTTASYDDDTIYYIDLPIYPALFKAAYDDIHELVNDMEAAYNDARNESEYKLPELSREDIRTYIRRFCGTYYG